MTTKKPAAPQSSPLPWKVRGRHSESDTTIYSPSGDFVVAVLKDAYSWKDEIPTHAANAALIVRRVNEGPAKDAAAYLGLDRSTLGEMLRKGELPFIPWRGSKIHKRLSRAALDRWIEAKQVRATNAGALLRAVDRRRS